MSDDEDAFSEPVMTQLAQNAANLHELYLSYIDAGFTEYHAFELVKLMMTLVFESNDD